LMGLGPFDPMFANTLADDWIEEVGDVTLLEEIAQVLTFGLIDRSGADRGGRVIPDMRYKVTEKTVFWVGQKKGAWSDLKIGAKVHVGYHAVGKDRVAYKVEIVP
jgi:hypothetical protein